MLQQFSLVLRVLYLELEREIFEATALLYPRTIPKFLHVARRVLLWKVTLRSLKLRRLALAHRVEPLLYNLIVIDTFENRKGSGVAVLPRIATKGAQFFSNAVRDDDSFIRTSSTRRWTLCFSFSEISATSPSWKRTAASTPCTITGPTGPQSFGSPASLIWPWGIPFPERQAGDPHQFIAPRDPLLSSEDQGTTAEFSEQLELQDPRVVLVGPSHVEGFHRYAGTQLLDELWAKAEEFVARKRSGEIPGVFESLLPSRCSHEILASDYYLEPYESPREESAESYSERHWPE
ncbi:hypothetical protein C8R44DRAFT_885347 [Mycena epipterygia]|nr:hypothetical protein C8R44DRAFT_885347 [Mycena epipterygia]